MRREDFQRPQPPPIDRPLDRWVCGHSDDDHLCDHIPDAHGVCSARGATCRPRLTWRYRRRRFVVAGVLVSLAAWMLMLAGSWRSKVLRPGMLTAPHAQILGSQLASARCAACHPAAGDSLLEWFSSAPSGHRGVTQSQLCMDCHHTTLANDRALMAHNLTINELHLVASQRSRWHSSWRDSLPGPAVDIENVHCAACHREHHGTEANLTLMTNAQCQTCHQDRFESFATDHPDWQDWPYRQDGAIAFDHVTHYGKHFADITDAKGQRFPKDCRTCHQRRADGEITRLVDFETSCAACHQAALRLEASEGIAVLAIPSLPLGPEQGIESWPKSATGFYDGRIGPLTRLLISDQGRVSEALSHLSSDGDLAKTDPNDAIQAAAAGEVALSIVRLMDELAVRGNAAIIDRLRRQGIPEPTAREVGRQLSPQLIYDARERWFGEAPQRRPGGADQPVRRRRNLAGLIKAEPTALAADLEAIVKGQGRAEAGAIGSRSQQSRLSSAPNQERDLLLDDPLLDDPLLDDPLLSAEEPGDRHSADGEKLRNTYNREEIDFASLMTFGGWVQDNRRLAIRYRGTQHADPVLRSVIDVALALPLDHPVRRELLSHRTTAGCVRCHRIDSPATAIRWDGQRLEAASGRFTKFSHRPHLHLPVLENCLHCHQVRDLERQGLAIRPTSTGEQNAADSHQFEPLTRQTCVDCHTAKAAGDRCTKCHRYHIDPMVTPADPG